MSYTINKTNSEILLTLLDGTTDSAGGLTFIGKNYISYGEVQNENFVRLLENFSDSVSPIEPLKGQLWYDASTTPGILKVYDGVRFKSVTGKVASGVAPSAGLVTGDAWWDTTNDQYKVYSGTDWVVVGPDFSKVDGKSGAIVEAIYDTGGNKHMVVSMYSNNNRTAIVSYDSAFTPNVSITGFATISPGVNLNTTVSNNLIHGTSKNAQQLGNVVAASYARKDQNETFAAGITVLGNVNLGANVNVQMAVVNNQLTINNSASGIVLQTQPGGTTVNSLSIDGVTGNVSVRGKPTTPLGVATKNYVDDTQTIINQTIAANVLTINTAINSNVSLINNQFANVNAVLDEHEQDLIDLNIIASFKAPIDSPDFTGIPQADTAPMNTSTRQIASTEYVMIESNSIKANIALAGYAKEAWVKTQGYFMANGFTKFDGTTFQANAGSISGYGAVSIKGSQGGYAGINFVDSGNAQCNSFLTNSTGAGGIYNRNSNGWVLQWNNSGDITATGDITAFSDAKLKTNINVIENSLAITANLRGVTFDKDGKPGLGVIAQELLPHLPMLVHANPDGTLSVAYGNMAGLFIENDKALHQQLQALQKEVEDLKAIVTKLLEK